MKSLLEYGFPTSFSPKSKSDVLKFYQCYNKLDRTGHLKRENGFKKLFPELYQDFQNFNFFGDVSGLKFYEKLYHFLMDDSSLKLGHCNICGCKCKFHLHGEFGYRNCCSNCNNKSQEKINQQLKTWSLKTSDEMTDMVEKMKSTKLERYGFSGYNNIKQIQKTKHKNDTYGKSLIEKKLIQWFNDNNYKFKYQYNRPEYPFNCDFYLPDFDLRIEIQGYFTHGFHPFNKDNQEDINLVEKWKKLSLTKPQYGVAVKTWIVIDPLKREIVKENNLNFLEIFSSDLDVCIEKILEKIKSGQH
jgi:hypothetical protein